MRTLFKIHNSKLRFLAGLATAIIFVAGVAGAVFGILYGLGFLAQTALFSWLESPPSESYFSHLLDGFAVLAIIVTVATLLFFAGFLFWLAAKKTAGDLFYKIENRKLANSLGALCWIPYFVGRGFYAIFYLGPPGTYRKIKEVGEELYDP